MKFHSIAQSSLIVLSVLLAPIHSFAAEAPYCIAVAGGFGGSGTTFVARNFTLPTESKCTPWSGYAKTAASIIIMTSGTSCLSSDSTALTVSLSSADPAFFGAGQIVSDYIELSRGDATESFTGRDVGYFGGGAEPVSCTLGVLSLPSTHD
jgi:hypothetical protein